MSRIYEVDLSSLEAKKVPLTFNLPSGVTLSSVTLTHTPPAGESAVSLTGTVVSASAGTALAELPKGFVEGHHLVSCVATTSDDDFSPEILLVVTVER